MWFEYWFREKALWICLWFHIFLWRPKWFDEKKSFNSHQWTIESNLNVKMFQKPIAIMEQQQRFHREKGSLSIFVWIQKREKKERNFRGDQWWWRDVVLMFMGKGDHQLKLNDDHHSNVGAARSSLTFYVQLSILDCRYCNRVLPNPWVKKHSD